MEYFQGCHFSNAKPGDLVVVNMSRLASIYQPRAAEVIRISKMRQLTVRLDGRLLNFHPTGKGVVTKYNLISIDPVIKSAIATKSFVLFAGYKNAITFIGHSPEDISMYPYRVGEFLAPER